MPTERLDALILGGGMAGLTAALWVRAFDLSCLVLEEGSMPGGQLHEIHAPITDYPLSLGRDGARFASLLLEEARSAELSVLVGEPVTRVSASTRSAWRGRERFRARALVIATGLRRRSLGIPGERELVGRGVSFSANRERDGVAGRPVVVIGGGTGAVEDALLCAQVGCDVTLIHHSTRFRARSDFLKRARAEKRIHIVPNAEVRAIVGENHVESVEYRTRGSGLKRVARADAVFLRIGWEPRSELLRGEVGLDRGGFVRVSPGGFTSVEGVFAAGDVCSPRWPSLANAAGQGAAAGLEIARYLGRVKS